MKLLIFAALVFCSSAFALPPDDPGYCGIGNIETGKHDPFWQAACLPHDDSMQAQKDHEQYKSNWETQSDLVEAIAKTTVKEVAEGIYCLVFGLPFAILGAGVGGFLMAKRRYKIVTTGGSSSGELN